MTNPEMDNYPSAGITSTEWQQKVDALFVRDRSLSFGELRAANVKRVEEVFHKIDSWSPTDWATALAGEVGEACNEIKKLRRLDGADASEDTPTKREELRIKVGRELADVIAYADLLAARLGIDLGDQVISKFNEVSKKRGSTVYL